MEETGPEMAQPPSPQPEMAQPPSPQPKMIQPSSPPKSPVLALILSLLLLGGAGQIYLGQVTKGIVLIVASLLLSCIGIGVIVWIVGVIDAYMIGQKLERGEPVEEWEFFWKS
jgi:TM2 domain-containing membrane protein YozV